MFGTQASTGGGGGGVTSSFTSGNYPIANSASNLTNGLITGDANNVFIAKHLISNGVGAISTNVSIGSGTLDSNTTGHNTVAIGNSVLTANTTGYANTAIGFFAMSSNIIGKQNVAIGDNAGQNSLGDGNVFIGNAAGQNETGSNKLYIANSNTSSPAIFADFASNYVGINTNNPTTRLFVSGAGDLDSWITSVATVTSLRSFVESRSNGGGSAYMISYGSAYAPTGQPFAIPGSNTFYGDGSAGTWVVGGSGGVHIANETVSLATFKNNGNLLNYLDGASPSTRVTQELSGSSITTVGATTSTVETIDLSVAGSYIITSRIPYKKTAGAGAGTVGDGSAFIITQSFQSVAGTVTATGVTQSDYTGTVISTESVMYVISGTNILVQSTGILNDTILWGSASTVNKI